MASFSLSGYSQIILDGTFFINRFPEEIIREMDEESLYLTPTFLAECSAYKPHMTPQQREVFDHNLAQLGKKLYNNKKLEYANDLWNNLCIISKTGRNRALLITSNLLLIQKVVLRQLRVDVYNLHELKFMPHTDFHSLKKYYQCKMDRQRRLNELPDSDEVNWLRGNTLDVYDDNGWLQILWKATRVENGLESIMYTDRSKPEKMVKVFNWAHRTAAKLENVEQLRKMNEEMLQCSWAAFPEMQVFLDAEREQPLGFYMKRFEGYRVLENEVRQETRNPKRFSTILEWCLTLASQIAYLGVFGIYVTDYTEQNFLIPPEGDPDPHIIMVDTDSFCQGEYFGARYKSEWDGWKILGLSGRTGAYVANKADAIDLGLKLLYAELFSILTAGQIPVVAERFVKEDPVASTLFADDGLLRYVFPGSVWSLMEDVFTRSNSDIRLPSVDLLLHELSLVKKNASDAELNMTYEELTKYHESGKAWSPNGLGTVSPQPAPEPDDDPKAPETSRQPQQPQQPQQSQQHQEPRREVRKVDRKNAFAQPRLMGAVIEGQPQETVGWEKGNKKLPFQPVKRKAANAWKNEQKEDRVKADRIGKWLTPMLMILLIALSVWLCFFAEIDLLYQIRQMGMDFLYGIVEWWQETIVPMIERFWVENVSGYFSR